MTATDDIEVVRNVISYDTLTESQSWEESADRADRDDALAALARLAALLAATEAERAEAVERTRYNLSASGWDAVNARAEAAEAREAALRDALDDIESRPEDVLRVQAVARAALAASSPEGEMSETAAKELTTLLTSPPKRDPDACPRCGGLGGTYEPVVGGRAFVPCSCRGASTEGER